MVTSELMGPAIVPKVPKVVSSTSLLVLPAVPSFQVNPVVTGGGVPEINVYVSVNPLVLSQTKQVSAGADVQLTADAAVTPKAKNAKIVSNRRRIITPLIGNQNYSPIVNPCQFDLGEFEQAANLSACKI